MNPGSPGSHSNDSIQDDDFLDSVSRMSDAKRRRVVEAGGMAGCKSSCAVVSHMAVFEALFITLTPLPSRQPRIFLGRALFVEQHRL